MVGIDHALNVIDGERYVKREMIHYYYKLAIIWHQYGN